MVGGMRAKHKLTSLRVVSVLGGVLVALSLVAGTQLAANTAATSTDGSPPATRPATTAAPAPPSPSIPPSPPARKPASSAEVPDGEPVPVRGAGSWHVVPGTSAVSGQGQVRTYTVEVEDGVALPTGDTVFALTVQATLADPRSWVGGGTIAVRRIDAGQPDVRIRLASQQTARLKCGYEIPIDVSCRSGNKVYLSAVRWTRGAVAFGADLTGYRQYMVNHEVGHFFGRGHRPCTAHGGPAPVMMQQTFSTSNNEILAITAGHPQGVTIPQDGKVCSANPWPNP